MAVAALLLALAGRGAALEIGCWPLFRYEHSAAGRTHLSVLGPLVEYEATATTRDLRVRPLFWLRRDLEARTGELAVLYPVASVGWRPDEWSTRLLLLSTRQRASDQGADGVRTRFTLFPLLFLRTRDAGPTDLGFLPFYLDLHDAYGFARIRAVAFPLFARFEQPRFTRTFVPFPFLSFVGGEDAGGVRVFPVAGVTEVAGQERSGYVAWPFFTWSDRLDRDYGWERRRVVFPVWASLEGEERESRSWGVAAYTDSVDRRRGVESIGSPWPFWLRERRLDADDYHTWRIAPFYGRSEQDGVTRRFYLWPLWRTRAEDAGTFHFRRRDAMLVAWRSQWDWDDATGDTHSLLTAVGMVRAEERSGAASGQAPAILDALLPTNRGILALWAPLTALVEWSPGPEESDWEVAFGLVGRRGGRMHGPWYVHADAR